MIAFLQVGKGLHQSQRLLLVDLFALLAIGDLNQLHLGEFRFGRHLLFHEIDPGVLVGGRGRGREDRELALPADQIVGAFQHHLGQAVAFGLIDEDRAGGAGDVGIIRDHPDALLRCALQRWGDRIGVIGGDCDHADLLRD